MSWLVIEAVYVGDVRLENVAAVVAGDDVDVNVEVVGLSNSPHTSKS